MNILQIQEEFMKQGYQWVERIYNDGYIKNCYVTFTKDKNPSALSTYPSPKDIVGWGRFTRESCWEQAYQWLNKQLPKYVYHYKNFYGEEVKFTGTEIDWVIQILAPRKILSKELVK